MKATIKDLSKHHHTLMEDLGFEDVPGPKLYAIAGEQKIEVHESSDWVKEGEEVEIEVSSTATYKQPVQGNHMILHKREVAFIECPHCKRTH